MKRKIAWLLSILMACTFMPVRAAAASGVVTDSPVIGDGAAKLVYITMDGNRTADVALANGSVHSAAASDALVNRVTWDGNSSVVAAVNGGFFNAYYNSGAAQSFPDNCPRIYSTIVKDGVLVNGVGETNMLGVTWDGKPYIDRVKYQATVQVNGTVNVGMWAVNNHYTDAKCISLFTPEFTLPVSAPQGSKVLTIKDGKVAAVSEAGSYKVAAGTNLMVYNAQAVADAQKWNQFPAVGDTAVVSTSATACKRAADLPQWNNMKTVIAGGRMLVQNTYNVVQDTSYNAEFDSDPKQAAGYSSARAFAAVMGDGRLVLGTANASMAQIAAYLKSAGAVNAVSLDGGASTMLYVNGSGYLTAAGRPLASAFVVVDEKVRETRPAAQQAAANPSSTTGVDANTPSAWAADAVARSKALGLVPDWMQYNYRSNLTRREFCVLIKELLEKKGGKSIDALRLEKNVQLAPAFSDTDDWYVQECASFGIVTGYNGAFKPNDSLTRQEAAAILQRATQVLGATAQGGGKSFADAAQIEPWARDAVAFVTANGIMNGEGDTFNPLGTYTREQAYITMVNAYDHL
ncbi:phosphodiester glycosidase family protein [Intestinibacillus massiliensis]|nr:phosphodiester glycosidase family protein [Intestinibacillus massiliensis]